MPRVLLIHHDQTARDMLSVLLAGHQIEPAKDLKSAMRSLLACPPDVVVVSFDKQQQEAAKLLRWMRDQALQAPVVVAIARGMGTYQDDLRKLGARGFVDHPFDRDRLSRAMKAAIDAQRRLDTGPPPVTPEELAGNLSVLERQLNRDMQCIAGRNQVYIQSTLLGGDTTRPRIRLRCPLRTEYGMDREVYYEHIRDICCKAPERCEAARKFIASREIA